jgi:hypothetical protein
MEARMMMTPNEISILENCLSWEEDRVVGGDSKEYKSSKTKQFKIGKLSDMN